MIFTLAWRNLWRHKRRTFFTMAAIALTCVVVVFLPSLQAGTYAGMVRNYIGILDGYAQIQHEDYLETPSMRDSFRPNDGLQAALKTLPAGIHTAERGVAYGLLSSEKRSIGAQIIGVQPEKETYISSLPSNIVGGHYLTEDNEIVLGKALADNLQVDVGDSVTLLGVGHDGSLAADVLSVAGIFRTGTLELDRSLAEMTLARFDTSFAMDGQRHEIVINGADPSALSAALDILKPPAAAAGLALRDWRALQPGLESAIRLDITSAVVIYAVLIIIVALSLLNTIFMSVLERTREFGMMMALGVTPGLLARVVWGEIGILALLGVLLGMGTGAGLVIATARDGITFESTQAIFAQYGMSSTMYPELTSLTLLAGPLAIVSALMLAGLFPALRILRLNLLKSMRAA